VVDRLARILNPARDPEVRVEGDCLCFDLEPDLPDHIAKLLQSNHCIREGNTWKLQDSKLADWLRPRIS
jgi:hypothetical protein